MKIGRFTVPGIIAENAWRIAIAVALVVATAALLSMCSGGKSARVKAELGENTTEAAIESGGDAVDTVGEAQAREDESGRKVKHAEDAIDRAPDAGAADAAARDGLCDVSADYC